MFATSAARALSQGAIEGYVGEGSWTGLGVKSEGWAACCNAESNPWLEKRVIRVAEQKSTDRPGSASREGAVWVHGGKEWSGGVSDVKGAGKIEEV